MLTRKHAGIRFLESKLFECLCNRLQQDQEQFHANLIGFVSSCRTTTTTMTTTTVETDNAAMYQGAGGGGGASVSDGHDNSGVTFDSGNDSTVDLTSAQAVLDGLDPNFDFEEFRSA
jgi:hypothetical protein